MWVYMINTAVANDDLSVQNALGTSFDDGVLYKSKTNPSVWRFETDSKLGNATLGRLRGSGGINGYTPHESKDATAGMRPPQDFTKFY